VSIYTASPAIVGWGGHVRQQIKQGKNIANSQPVTLAAMEGLFETAQGAPLAIFGQPDTG
jgi:cytochrome bd-type quinol oxidase subunit 1